MSESDPYLSQLARTLNAIEQATGKKTIGQAVEALENPDPQEEERFIPVDTVNYRVQEITHHLKMLRENPLVASVNILYVDDMEKIKEEWELAENE